jgi:RNA polymerase sigma factor (sigma-70 family)
LTERGFFHFTTKNLDGGIDREEIYMRKNQIIKTEIPEGCEAWREQIEALDDETNLNERRETRRHNSLEQSAERCDTEIADKRVDIEEDYIEREEVAILCKALETLTSEQRQLVQKVFFEGQAVTAVAKEYGVSHQAISDRLSKIFARLRKNF